MIYPVQATGLCDFGFLIVNMKSIPHKFRELQIHLKNHAQQSMVFLWLPGWR